MRKKIPRIDCPVCGNVVDNLQAKTCSHVCHSAVLYRAYIERWLRGEEDGNIGRFKDDISNHVRRWMFETRGIKCEKCGWKEVNPVTGRVPVQVNHRDGNYLNTKPENLDVLCPNCHSLTPSYGSLNNGRGRIGRRNRIAK